jgi:hypothetical protein
MTGSLVFRVVNGTVQKTHVNTAEAEKLIVSKLGPKPSSLCYTNNAPLMSTLDKTVNVDPMLLGKRVKCFLCKKKMVLRWTVYYSDCGHVACKLCYDKGLRSRPCPTCGQRSRVVASLGFFNGRVVSLVCEYVNAVCCK